MNIQNGEQILEIMRGFQVPCILAAAADLGLFETITPSQKTAAEVSAAVSCDLRGVTILLDALTAIGLIIKKDEHYSLPPELEPYLRDGSPQSVMAMIRHQANCLRRWSRLPWTIKTGKPDDPGPSLLGEDVDNASFIEAMNVVSRGMADRLIREITPGNVRCVLDLGGASGTWTMAWLKAEPEARAIIFDLPSVIPKAQERFVSSPFANRIELCAGDFFYTDELPRGADLAWVSAIIHQNSPRQNLALYRCVAAALKQNGWIYIRDIVMEPSRTAPVAGSLFAVNMLAGTEGGNCYTLAEIEKDLLEAGFHEVELVRRDEGMHSIVRAQVK